MRDDISGTGGIEVSRVASARGRAATATPDSCGVSGRAFLESVDVEAFARVLGHVPRGPGPSVNFSDRYTYVLTDIRRT